MAKKQPPPENEVTEMWRQVRADRSERNSRRCQIGRVDIDALSASGYQVEALTETQFRVGGVLDLYPTHRRFHHIPTGRRGRYDSVLGIVELFRVGRRA